MVSTTCLLIDDQSNWNIGSSLFEPVFITVYWHPARSNASGIPLIFGFGVRTCSGRRSASMMLLMHITMHRRYTSHVSVPHISSIDRFLRAIILTASITLVSHHSSRKPFVTLRNSFLLSLVTYLPTESCILSSMTRLFGAITPCSQRFGVWNRPGVRLLSSLSH